MQHQEMFITDKHSGLKLFTQYWEPDNATRAIVMVIHGLGEHSSRYQYIAEQFCKEEIMVYSFDLPGHGKSAGKRAFIKSFDICNVIIDKQINLLKQNFPNIPIILLGHSMGGAITTYFALKMKPDLEGIILSSAALKISGDISPLLVKLSGIIGKLLPTLPTIKLDSTGLSHRYEIIEEYDNDPLVYSGGIPARTGAEINRSIKYNQANAEKFNYPVLLIHGDQDRLADYHGSLEFHSKISSENKTIKLYKGLYHELMNEVNGDKIIGDLLDWIKSLIKQQEI